LCSSARIRRNAVCDARKGLTQRRKGIREAPPLFEGAKPLQQTTYYEPFVNGLGLKRGEYLRVISRIGVGMRNKRKS